MSIPGIKGAAPHALRRFRQRVPDRWRDDGEKGAGGLPRDRRRLVAHAAGVRNGSAHGASPSEGQHGRLHSCMDVIPRRRYDDVDGFVRRIVQLLHALRPCRVHACCNRQPRQLGEMIRLSAPDERCEDVGMAGVDDRRRTGIGVERLVDPINAHGDLRCILHRQPGQAGCTGVRIGGYHGQKLLSLRLCQGVDPGRWVVRRRLPPSPNDEGDVPWFGQQRDARVTGADQRRRRPACAAVVSNGIDQRSGMVCTPPGGRDTRPPRQDAVACVRTDQRRDSGGEGRCGAYGGREKVRHSARQRAERADDGINARCERQDAGEPGIVERRCDDVHVGFTVQRPQRCGKGGRGGMHRTISFYSIERDQKRTPRTRTGIKKGVA
jgi:hypothetical protein